MRLSTIALCFHLVCGALTGWLVAGLVPAGLRAPFLDREGFRLNRAADSPLEVNDARWFLLPSRIGDFDLQMDVELGPGVDLDVLLRQVQPRLVGGQLLPFHGRFSVLRMTTGREGPAWHTRDEALLGGRGGGVGLAPGHVATVWIEGRGRLLRANVAGKPLGTFVADDTYGMLTLVAKGGIAVVRTLAIQNRGQPRAWLWSRWTWAALGALGALVVAAATRAAGALYGGAVLAMTSPLIAWLFVREAELDLGHPDPGGMLALLAACSLIGLAWHRTWRFVVLLAAIVALLGYAEHTLERDTRVADELFGPRAGAQLAEAHAQLVRGPGGLHDVAQPGRRVFLLGGQPLYDRGMPAEHVELVLARELRAATRQAVVVPCLPTVDGHAAQQWRLFTTFFTGYRPDVVVLGVGLAETALDDTTNTPRSSPAQLAATIEAAKAHCAANAAKLVLFAEAALAPELLAPLRAAAAGGVPLVLARDPARGADPAAASAMLAEDTKSLAAAIAPLLRTP